MLNGASRPRPVLVQGDPGARERKRVHSLHLHLKARDNGRLDLAFSERVHRRFFSSLASTESPLLVDKVRQPLDFTEAVLAVSYIGRPFFTLYLATAGSTTRSSFFHCFLSGWAQPRCRLCFCSRGARFGHRLCKNQLGFDISQLMVFGSVDSLNCCSKRVSMCNSCSN